MRRKRNNPVASVYEGYPLDPTYDGYMKKCLRKYPYLYKMIDYIVDSKIAALRAEMYHMGICQPMSPGMMSPGMMPPGMPCPGIAAPYGGLPPRPGYPMMPM